MKTEPRACSNSASPGGTLKAALLAAGLAAIPMLLASCSTTPETKTGGTPPSEFNARITAPLGTAYAVELRYDSLLYTRTLDGRETKRARIVPTAKQWREFREALDKIDVWRWRAEYPNTSGVGGTQWSLAIAYPDHTVRISGNNNFPEADGDPNNKAEPTKSFRNYLAAVKKLLGGEQFE